MARTATIDIAVRGGGGDVCDQGAGEGVWLRGVAREDKGGATVGVDREGV